MIKSMCWTCCGLTVLVLIATICSVHGEVHDWCAILCMERFCEVGHQDVHGVLKLMVVLDVVRYGLEEVVVDGVWVWF